MTVGLLAGIVMHLTLGAEQYAGLATPGERGVYATGLLMLVIGFAAIVLYIFLIVRSMGGLYAVLFTFSATSLILLGLADFLYGVLHPDIASGISPASTFPPMADASDWLRLAGLIVLLVMVVRLMDDGESQGAHSQ